MPKRYFVHLSYPYSYKMSSSSLKVALVTASSAGLGAAIAKVLAANMRVIINYSSNAQRAELVQEEMSNIAGSDSFINDRGEKQPRFAAIRADLANRADIKRLVAETVSVMGRLDVVVSNGGWTRIRKFEDLDQNVDVEDWDRCYEINVKSHLYLLHEARVHLDAAQGSFVTVASVAGVKPSGSSIVGCRITPTWAQFIFPTIFFFKPSANIIPSRTL